MLASKILSVVEPREKVKLHDDRKASTATRGRK